MTKEQALEKLRYKCSRTEYCSGQVAATLRRWSSSADGLRKEDIPEIISVLISEKFVDDRRFANAFVRDKLKFNGWGKNKIAYKLNSLGISARIIEEALAENYYMDDGYGECGNNLCGKSVLENIIIKKWESLKKEELVQNRRAKLVRFALGRGFEYNEVLEILKRIEKNSKIKNSFLTSHVNKKTNNNYDSAGAD